MKKTVQTLLWCIFGLYAALMLWLLFGQRMGWDAPGTYLQRLSENLNLIPFRTIREFAYALGAENPLIVRHAVVNLAGNVVMFVPLGFFLPAMFPRLRKIRRFFLWLLVILLTIEGLQLVTLLGSCDVDDLILNIPGAALGYGIFCIFQNLWS